MLHFNSRQWIGCLVGTLALFTGVWYARQAPLTAADVEQSRLNVAAPIPNDITRIGQTFTAQHNGLSSVEVLAVVYGEASPANALTARLTDALGEVVIERALTNFEHNAPLRVDFPPQPRSAGQTYTLTLTGAPKNNTTVWAYGPDGYGRGTQLLDGQPTSGDLRFITTYTYLWADVMRDALIGLKDVALLTPALWLLLFAPGLLLLSLLFPAAHGRWSAGAHAGLALALSLSFLPLLWLWVSAVGLRLSAWPLLIVYMLIGALVILRAVSAIRKRPLLFASRFSLFGSLPLLLLLALVTRLLAARDLAFPMWVDSPHHLVVAQVLETTGRIPANYASILPVDNFNYHFGYHALLVSLQWFTGRDWPTLMLTLGQILQALVPLAVFAMIDLLTRRPRAALLGAFVVAIISYFPGYYLSWGRYTQLTGALVLAPLIGIMWLIARPAANGWAQTPRRAIAGLGLLIAGMIFVHYRMLFFGFTFAWAALAMGGRGGWKALGLAALLSAALALPWLGPLVMQTALPMLAAPQRMAAVNGYNAFPWDYFRGDLERGWLALAGAALMWGLLRRQRTVWLLAGWTALTTALLNIGPGTWLVNNNAWAITLFLPGTAALGWGGAEAWRIARQWWRAAHIWKRGLGLTSLAAFTALVAYASWRGVYLQVGIVNPSTMQATAADAEALAWVAQHTPTEAVFAVNGWRWLNTIWAIPDGGTWLWPLLGRRTTLPPIDYINQRDWAARVQDFNQRLSVITDANAPTTLALWQEAGATHIFIGAKGGALKPEMFVDSPHYHLLFSNGAAWVFEIVRP